MTQKEKPVHRSGRPRSATPVRSRAKPENMSDIDVLNRAIEITIDEDTQSAISDKAFAEKIIHCNVRTIRKYRDGRRIPPLVRKVCEDILRDYASIKRAS